MIKKFTVNGMHCAMCAKNIEDGLIKKDGIKKVTVSLIYKEMTVDFDENVINDKEIINAVKDLGFSVSDFNEKKVVDEVKVLKNRFIVSLIALIPLMYLSMGGMFSAPLPSVKLSFILQFLLSGIVLIINAKYIVSGIKSFKNRSLNMDALVMTASILAYTYSTIMSVLFYAGVYLEVKVFFSAAAMVPAIVDIGKYLEEKSKKKTGDATEKLSSLIPDTATVIREDKEIHVSVKDIVLGDTVVIKNGEYVPIDGTVIFGDCMVDKSAITGESMPEEANVNSYLISGSMVTSGYVKIRAEKVGEDTVFNKIIERVKTASAEKAPVQKIADKIAGVFVPVVLALSLITFIVWFIISKDLYKSLNFAISVTVISCPCALGLATPVAVVATTGKAATLGILYKNAEAIENTGKINCVIFDKTGTITEGKPSVIEYKKIDQNFSDEQIFKIISSLEEMSNHPLSTAILNYCGTGGLRVEDFNSVTGAGVYGEIDGKYYYAGNNRAIPKNITVDSDATVFFADDEKLIAEFYIADTVKEDAIVTVKALKEKGIKTVMLTGDNYKTAKVIANRVLIDEFYAGVSPEEKAEKVKEYKDLGFIVAMVGDGINDSPALKTADIGVAMGNGTDIAIDASDIVAVNGNPKSISNAISLSKKAFKIIKENLFWAFIYNALAIPVAAGVFSFIGIMLTPIISSACMCLSSIFVVLNALRINKFKS